MSDTPCSPDEFVFVGWSKDAGYMVKVQRVQWHREGWEGSYIVMFSSVHFSSIESVSVLYANKGSAKQVPRHIRQLLIPMSRALLMACD